MEYNLLISKENLYFIEYYIRCGEVPLYLLSYSDRFGKKSQSVILCSFKNLDKLIRKHRRFKDPAKYGKVTYISHSQQPIHMLSAMLKERYDYDLPVSESGELILDRSASGT